MNETLPKRNFFKLSEVVTLLNVKPHEVHFWESEFPQIRAQKSHSGQRMYRRDDVVLFSAIKHLLHDRKFTVAGARRVLAEADVMRDEINAAKEQNIAVHEVPVCVQTDTLDVLGEAAALLPEEEEYQATTHELYQDCAEELETVTQEVEPEQVGMMLSAALQEQKEQHERERRLRKIEQEKAMSLLHASQQSLNDVLQSLESIKPSDFWRGF